MLKFVGRRTLYMVPTLLAISVVIFVVINLPPGDYVTSLVAELRGQGQVVSMERERGLRELYGLNRPLWEQYVAWVSDLLRGDLGRSFDLQQPVAEVIRERLPITVALAGVTLLFTWIVAFPIGVYAAVKQYSIGDYLATTFGFLGLAIPNFLLALLLMTVSVQYFGYVPEGLCSPEYCDASWNLGKVLDALKHWWLPVIVIGTAGTAGLIRILRANLLDELRKPYVVAARARGVPKRRLVARYPLRVAMNPFVSTVGWVLPLLLAGDVIVAQILSLPTLGRVFLTSLQQQDMYLAGSILMIYSLLTVIGTMISDLLLAWLDPRVRLGYQ
ncbi:ABC transporter permease [Actinobacteria bacterium YIM 96077]|uniref:ABC transporter permease n=1 Tax=Phytoactinopolyspora halophila TaxID=1981511 RepID=A0A329QCZ5_9ACTN|nr:ABC transporter permease [Phytoactinopolyspora halophila]AYY14034.1 ABC transporter permease [Actinobacteria bacterium YIM 96077]RAW10285.1 ABC transporter permease [Phytoactinopolyspora halophila]